MNFLFYTLEFIFQKNTYFLIYFTTFVFKKNTICTETFNIFHEFEKKRKELLSKNPI